MALKTFESQIPVSLGDNIMIRAALDAVKHEYSEIRISHYKHLIDREKVGNPAYYKFIKDLGRLLYSEPPFIFDDGNYTYRDQETILKEFSLTPQKPNLRKEFCEGTPLDIKSKYIVLTTKVRYLNKTHYKEIYNDFWQTINALSNKYKIIIMGERSVEYGPEYAEHGRDIIYSIYDDVIKNINSNNLIDLSIKSLGHTSSPNLEKIKQDSLIMSQAEFVITLGVGGNLVLAIATSKVIGHRSDKLEITNEICDRQFHEDIFITLDFDKFNHKLKEYLKSE